MSRYIAITPARDEEKFLPLLIASMAAQNPAPGRWIVIDDGSSDATAAILDEAARTYPWIEPHHLPRNRPRAPGGAAWHEIRQPEYHTRGPAKMYSRACFNAIGELDPDVGWDTLDEARAMLRGFHTRGFRHITARHHRPQGEASGMKARMMAGFAAYRVGYSPLFILARAVRETFSRPSPFEGALLLAGFLKGYIRREPRCAEPELVRFIRRHQHRRLLLQESLWR